MKVLIVSVCALGLGGCASVVRGTDEQIAFQSEPAGAHLQLSNGLSCSTTPCDLKVARKDEFTATFTKDGYQQQDIRVTTHVSGGGVAAGAGNVLAGGLIGVGVDAYNGANLDHQPNPVLAHMVATAPSKPGRPSKVPVS